MPILIVVVTLFEITKYDTNMEEGIIVTVCNARKKATRNVVTDKFILVGRGTRRDQIKI